MCKTSASLQQAIRSARLPVPVRTFCVASLALLLAACNTTPIPVVTGMPAVSEEIAATLTLRSKDNFGDTKHRHVLMIDGIVAGRFKEEDVQSFQVAEGKHQLQLTCHSRHRIKDEGTPFNFSVIDGKTSLEIDLLAGDSVCLKIGFNPLNCAVLQETSPSYCE